MDLSPHFLSSMPLWALLSMLATAIVHIAFSAAVFNDAKHIHNEHQGLAFVGPIIWSLAVLIGGVLVAVVYWIIHHSTLRR